MSDNTEGAAARAGSPTTLGEAPGLQPATDGAGREPGDFLVALSPRQIIGGFALLAGVIVWLGRRSRRKR